MSKRKPSLRVGLPVLAIGIAMISVGYFGVQPLQNGRPPACFPQSCPSLVLFAFLGLAGFFVALWGGGETIAGFLIREGVLEYHTGPLPPPQPGSDPEDENILSMARELQRVVKRPKFGEITNIAWSEYQPWYSGGLKRKRIRQPVTLLFFADFRGRLDPEEWRTLLTYYFFHFKPRMRIVLRYFGSMMCGFLLIPVGGILANLIDGLPGGRFYGEFIGGPASLILLVLILPLGKRFALRMDRWVAEQMGQRALLDLFKTIDSFQLPRIENAKKRHGWTLRLWPIPDITKRMKKLTDEV